MNLKHVVKQVIAASATLFILSTAPCAHAATYTVDRTDDAEISACSATSNDCSLRGAITVANATVGADTIDFDIAAFNSAQTIALTTDLPNLTSNVTVTGPGAGLLTVKEAGANHLLNIFTVNSGVSATLSGLTLSNAYAGIENNGTLTAINCTVSGNGGRNGGGIDNASGTLTVTNCTISGNTNIGISNLGTVTVTNCTISGNIGDGIYNSGLGSGGTLTVTNCTISDNTNDGINNNSTLTATNCTLSGNGRMGILNSGGTLTATNCTVSDNTHDGIYNYYSGTATLINCTVSGNPAYGIYKDGTGTVTLKNTLVAGNNYVNVQGAFTDGGHNITSGTAAQVGLDPAGLQNNGGPTKTIRLIAGSPAIDAGGFNAPATDQRGATRPYDDPAIFNAGGDGSDIGAFELSATIAVNNPRSLPEGNVGSPGSVTFDVTLSMASTQSVTVNYQTSNGTNNPAIAGTDYNEKHGKLTFAPGETLKRVTITFIGDSTVELNETFFFDLLTPTNAIIADNRGVGQINNDDGPGITIDNALPINEGSAGTSSQIFTVHLSAASTDTITVDYATADKTAIAGSDYVAQSGTLTFAPGEISKTVTVFVRGDTDVEPNESYKVVLSKVNYAFIVDGLGIGTIRNDDATPSLFEGEPSQ